MNIDIFDAQANLHYMGNRKYGPGNVQFKDMIKLRGWYIHMAISKLPQTKLYCKHDNLAIC